MEAATVTRPLASEGALPARPRSTMLPTPSGDRQGAILLSCGCSAPPGGVRWRFTRINFDGCDAPTTPGGNCRMQS